MDPDDVRRHECSGPSFSRPTKHNEKTAALACLWHHTTALQGQPHYQKPAGRHEATRFVGLVKRELDRLRSALEIFNSTPYDPESVLCFERLAQLDNQWRRRHVAVFQHPYDPDSVVTVGTSYDGRQQVIVVEPKTQYGRAIAAFPRTVVYE